MTSNSPADPGPLPSIEQMAGNFPQPRIREPAFDAAQRLVLSQPFMAIGQLEQNRVADYILQMAERFEGWMMAQPPLDLRSLDSTRHPWIEPVWQGWDASR